MKLIRGIILAGGNGSRLFPLTYGTSKQLLPVYDKPMIYYPLSIFMHADIRDILIISTPQDLPKFKKLLGDGKRLGLNINYKIQAEPNGIAESFLIGEDFIGDNNVCLILGDNIFHGENFISIVNKAKHELNKGISSIFGVSVNNPENFGVVEFDNENNIKEIIEKPSFTSSKIVVSGLYFYTNDVINYAKGLSPSVRGEKEITDINNYYLSSSRLKLNLLDSKISWIDTGTYSSLIEASKYFEDYETNTGKKVACVEEIAYRLGYINKKQLEEIAESMFNSEYGKYLFKIINK